MGTYSFELHPVHYRELYLQKDDLAAHTHDYHSDVRHMVQAIVPPVKRRRPYEPEPFLDGSQQTRRTLLDLSPPSISNNYPSAGHALEWGHFCRPLPRIVLPSRLYQTRP